MKKLGLIGILTVALVIVIAIVTAGKMGETSHAFARGKVVLADELKEQAKGITTLYIIVGYPDRPMPYGALRKTISDPPQGELYDFVMTYDRIQRMQEIPWPEEFKLKARLDRDGAAGPDQPGDLVGEIALVQQGAEGLEIKIDHVVP